MSAAIATPPISARDAIFGTNPNGPIQEDVNLNAFRYFVQFGWDILSVGTPTIPFKRLLRGEITPCRTVPIRRNYYEIREGDRIPGSEMVDPMGKDWAWASERAYAHYEANNLIELEASADRKTGLIEITALRAELGDRLYRVKDLNKLFFPEFPFLPDTHQAVIEQLESRLSELRSVKLTGADVEYEDLVFQIGAQLLDAVRAAERIQRDLVTRTHSQMKLAPKDEGHKAKYDLTDYEMLRRTGLPEIHTAEIQTAQALDKLSDKAANKEGDIKELVTALREQSAQQMEMIKLLFAERRTVMAEPEPPETPAAPTIPKPPQVPKVNGK